jgi:hypothetical protein
MLFNGDFVDVGPAEINLISIFSRPLLATSRQLKPIVRSIKGMRLMAASGPRMMKTRRHPKSTLSLCPMRKQSNVNSALEKAAVRVVGSLAMITR